jgi:3-oxoacyl-[acyl-carrier-protein] synthase II
VALKSYMGNLGAGGGAVELIASLLAMQKGRLFPVLNCDNRDPQCDINVVTNHETPAGDSVLNMNVTMQGQASAIMVRKFA